MMKFLAIAAVMLAGCSATELTPQLQLSDDKSSNAVAIASYVPVGTSASNALQRMEKAGFDCRIYRDQTHDMLKGTTYIGEVGPLDHIACSKPKSGSPHESWSVILILDHSDTVSRHSLTVETSE